MTDSLRHLLPTLGRIALLLALGYAALCLIVALSRNRIVFPIRGGPAGDPRRFGIGDGELVTILTADGARLGGWFLPPAEPTPAPWPAVLWFHGNGETVRGLAPVIRELRPAHAGMRVVDYRGYGESTGHTTIPGTLTDAEAAWAWLAQRSDVDTTRVVIYGRSVGSGPAAWLAAHHTPAGLILESAFTSLRAMAAVHYAIFPSFLAGSGYDNLSAVRRVRAPALFMHGQTDDIVPIAMGRALAAAAGGPAEFWEIVGAGHNETYDADLEGYARRFKTFVARVAESAAPG
jgi:dipeptidyl aminopeptidase/acylaminoacyl peptidase